MRQSATIVSGNFAGRARRMLRAAALVAGVAALSACASAPKPGGGGQGGAQPKSGGGAVAARSVDPRGPVTVALLAPTNSSSEAARRAAQDLTAAAQIAFSERAPSNLTMKIYDTKGTGPGAAEAAAHAIREGAALIIGPLLGESTVAVAPIAAQAGLNVLSFSNDASVAGGNVWVVGRLPEDELRRLFGYASSQGVASIALAYPRDRYGDAVAAAAQSAAREAGAHVGPVVSYERSFQGIESASKSNADAIAGSDGVLIADAGDALRSMAAFLSYYNVSPRNHRYLGLSRWEDPRNASEASLQGGWFVAPDPSLSAAFAQRFAARMNRQPSPLAAIGYDAAAAAVDMLRDAASGGPAAFSADSITATPHDGATGSFRLTPDGHNRRSLAVMEMTGQGPALLDPAPGAAPGA